MMLEHRRVPRVGRPGQREPPLAYPQPDLADYLRLHGRVARLGDEGIAAFQAAVDADWRRLLARCG